MAPSGLPHITDPIPGAPSRVPGTPDRVPDGAAFGPPPGIHLHDMQGLFVKNGFGYEWTGLVDFFNMPDRFGDAIIEAIDKNMRELTQEIEDYAKDNAPWQDQTGNARRGLKAIYIPRKDRFEIDLGHSVRYGYFLETFNGGVLAIIIPTLRRFAPRMTEIKDLHLNSSTVRVT